MNAHAQGCSGYTCMWAYLLLQREIDIRRHFVDFNIVVHLSFSDLLGEIIDDDIENKEQSTKYKLFGVVVHSGQASGGHYYSYIFHR